MTPNPNSMVLSYRCAPCSTHSMLGVRVFDLSVHVRVRVRVLDLH